MARWHYFTYDQDTNEGGSVCGKYGLKLLGRSRVPMSFHKHPREGDSVCEQCAQADKTKGAI